MKPFETLVVKNKKINFYPQHQHQNKLGKQAFDTLKLFKLFFSRISPQLLHCSFTFIKRVFTSRDKGIVGLVISPLTVKSIYMPTWVVIYTYSPCYYRVFIKNPAAIFPLAYRACLRDPIHFTITKDCRVFSLDGTNYPYIHMFTVYHTRSLLKPQWKRDELFYFSFSSYISFRR